MKIFFVPFLLLLSTSIMADGLRFGEPLIEGPGCYPSSVSWTLAPDNSALSILLGKFSLTAGPEIGPARIYCQITLPISTLNQTIISADYRGFHDLPPNSNSERRVSYRLNNGIQTTQLDSVYGEDTNTYTHTRHANITCNGTKILKIFVDSFLSSYSTSRNASYSLDTIDLAEATTPGIALQICNGAAATTSTLLAFVLTMAVAWHQLVE